MISSPDRKEIAGSKSHTFAEVEGPIRIQGLLPVRQIKATSKLELVSSKFGFSVPFHDKPILDCSPKDSLLMVDRMSRTRAKQERELTRVQALSMLLFGPSHALSDSRLPLLTSLANIAPPSGAWGLCSTSFFLGLFAISLLAGHVGNMEGSTGSGDS